MLRFLKCVLYLLDGVRQGKLSEDTPSSSRIERTVESIVAETMDDEEINGK